MRNRMNPSTAPIMSTVTNLRLFLFTLDEKSLLNPLICFSLPIMYWTGDTPLDLLTHRQSTTNRTMITTRTTASVWSMPQPADDAGAGIFPENAKAPPSVPFRTIPSTTTSPVMVHSQISSGCLTCPRIFPSRSIM